MTQNSWKILVTKSIDDAMHCYFFFFFAKNEGKFPSWGNLPICALLHRFESHLSSVHWQTQCADWQHAIQWLCLLFQVGYWHVRQCTLRKWRDLRETNVLKKKLYNLSFFFSFIPKILWLIKSFSWWISPFSSLKTRCFFIWQIFGNKSCLVICLHKRVSYENLGKVWGQVCYPEQCNCHRISQ